MLNMSEYGELYFVAGGKSVTIATAGTPVTIAALVAGDSRYTVLNASAGKIKLAKGKHLVRAHVGVKCTAGAQEVGLNVATLQAGTTAAVAKSKAVGLADATDPVAITSEAIVTSDGTTEVLVQVSNEGSNDNLTVETVQFLAIGLDTQPPRPGTP